jgi:hypothetical protein
MICIAHRYDVRDFRISALNARTQAARWMRTARDFDFVNGVGAVRGVSNSRECELMAVEWLARAELAEAYAQRAARTEGRA